MIWWGENHFSAGHLIGSRIWSLRAVAVKRVLAEFFGSDPEQDTD